MVSTHFIVSFNICKIRDAPNNPITLSPEVSNRIIITFILRVRIPFISFIIVGLYVAETTNLTKDYDRTLTFLLMLMIMS